MTTLVLMVLQLSWGDALSRGVACDSGKADDCKALYGEDHAPEGAGATSTCKTGDCSRFAAELAMDAVTPELRELGLRQLADACRTKNEAACTALDGAVAEADSRGWGGKPVDATAASLKARAALWRELGALRAPACAGTGIDDRLCPAILRLPIKAKNLEAAAAHLGERKSRSVIAPIRAPSPARRASATPARCGRCRTSTWRRRVSACHGHVALARELRLCRPRSVHDVVSDGGGPVERIPKRGPTSSPISSRQPRRRATRMFCAHPRSKCCARVRSRKPKRLRSTRGSRRAARVDPPKPVPSRGSCRVRRRFESSASAPTPSRSKVCTRCRPGRPRAPSPTRCWRRSMRRCSRRCAGAWPMARVASATR